MPEQLTLPIRVYAVLANLALPWVFRRVSRRLLAQGVNATRVQERLGHATLPRPDGPLIWCHAASVGESVSLLALIDQLLADDPRLHVLVTSGTASSAQVLAGRLPVRAMHQFAPLDGKRPLARFLAHWQPERAVFVESEIWPQMILATAAAGIALALVNARMSKTSLRNWARFPATARALLSRFSLIRTQGAEVAQALIKLGANPATTGTSGNLKAASRALPFNSSILQGFVDVLHEHAVWAAVSTHPGEEELILWAHHAARDQIDNLTLILVPRHAERGAAVEKLCHDAGFRTARRSQSQPILPDTAVYLADTLGETGLWFALAPLVFLGGSLVPVGGHNPYEPALAGAAILHGPFVANTPAFAGFDAAGGAMIVPDAAGLARAVVNLLSDLPQLQAMQSAAKAQAAAQSGDLTALARELRGV
jgi:3-deoxy-D-manno-octulosonic-acid transferase